MDSFLCRIRISIFLEVGIRIRHPGLGTYKSAPAGSVLEKKRPVAAARSQCQTGRPSQDLTIPSHGTVYYMVAPKRDEQMWSEMQYICIHGISINFDCF